MGNKQGGNKKKQSISKSDIIEAANTINAAPQTQIDSAVQSMQKGDVAQTNKAYDKIRNSMSHSGIDFFRKPSHSNTHSTYADVNNSPFEIPDPHSRSNSETGSFGLQQVNNGGDGVGKVKIPEGGKIKPAQKVKTPVDIGNNIAAYVKFYSPRGVQKPKGQDEQQKEEILKLMEAHGRINKDNPDQLIWFNTAWDKRQVKSIQANYKKARIGYDDELDYDFDAQNGQIVYPHDYGYVDHHAQHHQYLYGNDGYSLAAIIPTILIAVCFISIMGCVCCIIGGGIVNTVSKYCRRGKVKRRSGDYEKLQSDRNRIDHYDQVCYIFRAISNFVDSYTTCSVLCNQ